MLHARLRRCLSVLLYLYAFQTASASSLEQTPDAGLAKLLQKIYLERKFYTLVIFGATSGQHSCVNDHTLKTLNISTTIMLLDTMHNCSLQGFNREVLILSCVHEPFKEYLLDTMLHCLANLRNARIVFHWQLLYGSNPKHPQHLRELFAYCARNFLPKAISVFPNFTNEQRFYTYNKFPEFTVTTHSLKEPCFPSRMLNMHGAPFRTLPDHTNPLTIVYRDKAGQVQVGGLMIKLFKAFTEKHNATLTYPLPIKPEVVVGYIDLGKMIDNGTLEVVMGLIGAYSRLGSGEVTTSVLQSTFLPMIPYGSPLPVRQFLPLIFCSTFGLNALVLLLLLSALLTFEAFLRQPLGLANTLQLFLGMMSTTVLRSLLGQAAHLRPTRTCTKCLFYLSLFFTGMLVTTVTTAYLQAYFTSPPKPVKINSFEDLLASPIRLRTSKIHYRGMEAFTSQEFRKTYREVFIIAPNNEYYKQCMSLDTRYGYTVSGLFWNVVEEHQARLPQPLFSVSDQMYFAKGLPMCIPIAQHSIYRSAINRLIGQLQSAGLIQYWSQHGHDDMVQAGLMQKQKIYGKDQRHPLRMEDFYWILWIYVAGMALSAVVALLERFYYTKIAKRHQK